MVEIEGLMLEGNGTDKKGSQNERSNEMACSY